MITETFDALTEDIIRVNPNGNAPAVDACILTFSGEILASVLERFECTQLGNFWSSNGSNPVYSFYI